jgi:hypothetical protein
MFSNSSPLNWHNTLKRLKKDDDFGRSPHSLNYAIVKRRPASLYIAHATRDIVKEVDKVHKEVPGMKKLIKEAGAKGGSDIIADGTATSSASGTHISNVESREGSASFISSRPGDLTVSMLPTPTPQKPRTQENPPVTPRYIPPHRRSKASTVASAVATPDAGSFHTARSGSPQETPSSATKQATRQLFSETTNLPASQVSAVNNRSRVGRAKGARIDSAVKPLSKRPTPARGAGGKFLKREGGGAVGRSAVVKDAMGVPGPKPKRKRSPKATNIAGDATSVQSNNSFKPEQIKARGLNLAARGVGPQPRRRITKAPAPPAGPPPAPAPLSTPAPPTTPAVDKPTYDKIKHLKLPGLQKLLAKHKVDIPEADMQSPKKIKAHLKKHFNL